MSATGRRKRPGKRVVIPFLAGDKKTCMELIGAMHGNGKKMELLLEESKEVGGIGFLVFEEK